MIYYTIILYIYTYWAERGPWEAAVLERHFFSDELPLLLLGSADII